MSVDSRQADAAQRLAAALAENARLRARLEEAEDTLSAIQNGEVDALVVGNDIYTLDSAHAASNRLRKDVLTQMEDAVLAYDADDHVIFMNPAAERQYGLGASAALGRPRAALYAEDWPAPDAEAAVRAALGDSGTARFHSIHRLAAGPTIHVESTVARLRDADGRDAGRLSVIRDISERVHAEDALHDAAVELARRERQFSTLVENSPDIFSRMDRDGRHVYVSPVIERYTGLPAAHFLGKTNAELGMPEEICERWSAMVADVFRSGEVARVRFVFPTTRDGERHFDARLVPEFADDGSVESVLSIASDMTDQELVNAALRESRERLEFTLDSARVGDWELDVTTGTMRHSLQHDRCFGYTAPVASWSFSTLLRHIHPDDREQVTQSFARSLAEARDWKFSSRVIWPDDSLHWIEVHGSLYLEAGKPRRMLGVVVDSTERMLAGAALKEADRRKDEFLATLAHELRNPLAPICNALQVMTLSREAAIHDSARAVIERQVRHMVHLVDDLMDVSRISRGKIELRRELTDVTSVVRTAIETSKPLIDAGGHQLIVQLPEPGALPIEGDTTRLCQAIANLLNNAAKYTPDGGRIGIAAERAGDQAVIAVRDSGVGISPDMLPRVFDMFAQVDRSLDRAKGGLGIGLALVKQLVQMHGGSVDVYSEGQGHGCEFVVRLPVAA